MYLLRERPMGAKRGGRPPKEAGEQGTRQLRVYSDLAEMVTEIADVLDTTTASVLDPIARGDIEELYEQHRPAIERMKALKKQQEEIRSQVAKKAAKR